MQWVGHFGLMSLARVGSRLLEQDLVLLLQLAVPVLQFPYLSRITDRRDGPRVYAFCYGNPTLERRHRQPESLCNLRQRHFPLAGHIDNILAELRPISRGHGQHPCTSTGS